MITRQQRCDSTDGGKRWYRWQDGSEGMIASTDQTGPGTLFPFKQIIKQYIHRPSL